MPDDIRFTRRARAELLEIALWTYQTFGPQQAEKYEELLIRRLQGAASKELHTRTADQLTGDKTLADIELVTAGRHLIFFIRSESRCTVISVLHDSVDLPRHLDNLNPKDP